METKLLIVLIFVFVLLVLLFIFRRKFTGAISRFNKNHVIVIGLSRAAREVAINLARAGRKVIVICNESPGTDSEMIRLNGGTVFSNSSYSESSLRAAGLSQASTVFAATHDDDTNIKISQLIARLKKRKYGGSPLKLMVQVDNHDLFDLISDYLDVSSAGSVDVQPFNINGTAAKCVYDKFPPHTYLGDETSKDTEKIICIVGNNEIARLFLIENSILSHYGDAKKLKVFLLCENAEQYYNSITKQYPNLGDFLEIIPVELRNTNFSSKHKWDEKFLGAVNSIDAVYFFGDNDAMLINSALHCRQFLFEKTGNLRKVPVIVCLPEETSAINLVGGESETPDRPSLAQKLREQVVIHFIGKYTDTCSVKNIIEGSGENEILAKVVNYYYSLKYEFDGLLHTHFRKSGNQEFIKRLEREVREFKIKRDDPIGQIDHLVSDFIKEYTKNSSERIKSLMGVERLWSNLTERKKESNRYVARHLDVKLFILKKSGLKTLTKDEIYPRLQQLAPIEHNRWSAEKFAFNFTYGQLPATDKNLRSVLKDTLKIHDQLVPFNKLDDVNKEKDLDMFYLLPLLQKIKDNIRE